MRVPSRPAAAHCRSWRPELTGRWLPACSQPPLARTHSMVTAPLTSSTSSAGRAGLSVPRAAAFMAAATTATAASGSAPSPAAGDAAPGIGADCCKRVRTAEPRRLAAMKSAAAPLRQAGSAVPEAEKPSSDAASGTGRDFASSSAASAHLLEAAASRSTASLPVPSSPATRASAQGFPLTSSMEPSHLSIIDMGSCGVWSRRRRGIRQLALPRTAERSSPRTPLQSRRHPRTSQRLAQTAG